MLVIVDTSILVQDFHLAGAKAQTFVAGLRHVPQALIGLPAVVLEEVVSRYTGTALEHLERAATALGRLEDLVGYSCGTTIPAADLQRTAAEYRTRITASLGAGGVEVRILPYPSVQHSLIVPLAIAKRRPFSQNGAGYRDYLIWASVLESLQASEDRVIFITANTSDFGKAELHPDLHEQLQAAGLRAHQLEYFNDLQQFNEKYIIPRLTQLDHLAKQLDGTDGTGEFLLWAKRELPKHIPLEIIRSTIRVPVDVGELIVRGIHRTPQLEVIEVHGLRSDDFLVHARAKLLVDLWFRCNLEDYARSPRAQELMPDVSLGSDDIAQIEISIPFQAEFEVVLDMNAHAKGAPDIRSIQSVPRGT